MTAQELLPKEKQELKGEEQVRPGRYYVPDVDILEDKDGLKLRADVPGADPARVSVGLEKDTLTIQAELSLDEYRDLSPVYTEYNVGHFLRRFAIPRSAAIDADRISAKLVDGVLEVVLPRAESAKPRRIAVSVG
jgi:HSP20 family molecular chaperone IbpA